MKVIISTVGVSLIRNNLSSDKFSDLFGRPVSEWEEHQARLDTIGKELITISRSSDFDPIRFSAETNSLSRIEVNKRDILVFLTSDTLDGVLCGKVLTEIGKRLWGAKAEYRVVKGLQVKDAELFRKVAVDHLVDTVMSVLDRYPVSSYKVILNPTGGYKAVVPYLTLLGLIEGIPVKYIYEQSNTLIELPAAPLSFNLEKLRELGPAAAVLSKDYVAEDELSEMIGISKYRLRKEFADVLVWEEGLVTLTAFARILYLRYIHQEGQLVKLSKPVRKKLKKNPSWENKFAPLFEKMRDPLYRKAHLHNEVQSDRVDLDCLKPGDVNERIFFFVEGETVYICDIFMHDEYEKVVNEGTLLKRMYLDQFDVPIRKTSFD